MKPPLLSLRIPPTLQPTDRIFRPGIGEGAEYVIASQGGGSLAKTCGFTRQELGRIAILVRSLTLLRGGSAGREEEYWLEAARFWCRQATAPPVKNPRLRRAK